MAAKNFVTTTLFRGRASDFGSWSGLTPKHAGMVHHQIMLASSGSLAAGVYNIRMQISDTDTSLESTVYSGQQLTIAGADSAIAVFTGLMRGIHLEVATSLSGGETISCVLTSSTESAGDLQPSQVA